MKLRKPILALSIAFLAACGASDADEETLGVASAGDALTAEEMAAGAFWNDQDFDDPNPVEGDTQAPLLAPEDPSLALDADGFTPPDVGDLGQLQSAKCHRATGYRHGQAMTLCVVRVDGKLVERRTAAVFLNMRAAAAKAGVHIHVVSGFRTMAQQRRLYWLYKHGQGNLAAPPGYSNHQSGHALDLNTASPGVYSWLANHGHAYSFKRTVPSEKWHWEHW